MTETQYELAVLLIAEVRDALANGTKHYDQAGRLLKTPLEIIECLRREGSVTLEPERKLEPDDLRIIGDIGPLLREGEHG